MYKLFISACALIAIFSLNGCSWVGETVGKAKAGVENAISDTKEGYHKGYAEEKEEAL